MHENDFFRDTNIFKYNKQKTKKKKRENLKFMSEFNTSTRVKKNIIIAHRINHLVSTILKNE